VVVTAAVTTAIGTSAAGTSPRTRQWAGTLRPRGRLDRRGRLGRLDRLDRLGRLGRLSQEHRQIVRAGWRVSRLDRL
jgi:hypothetical protein